MSIEIYRRDKMVKHIKLKSVLFISTKPTANADNPDTQCSVARGTLYFSAFNCFLS